MHPLNHDPEGGQVAQPEAIHTPYRDAARTYRQAGWPGVLPIPYRRKKFPPDGYTGHGGAWPSDADIAAWCDNTSANEGGGNIALRLQPDIIGIDVDAYDGKQGARTIADAVARWGPLPDTWMSSARDDGISKIRLFRVPEGLRWPGQLGPHVEIIQAKHRYMMVWPSINPETGTTYRWYRPDGVASVSPPRVDDIPDLPHAWTVGLTGGELAEDVHIADLSTGQATAWLTAHSAGTCCRAMQAVLDTTLEDLRTGSAHESLRHLMGLVRFAEQGHTGLAIALGELHRAFLHEVTGARSNSGVRTEQEARGEWNRSLAGAVRRIVGDPTVHDETVPDDPCNLPLGDLIAPGERRSLPVASIVPTPQTSPPPPAASSSGPTALALRQAAATVDAHVVDTETVTDSDTGPGPGTTEDVADSDETPERTDWWPIDLTAVLTGEQTEPEPAVLARSDGKALFYAGKVNGLLGESESGKTWLLLAAMVQQMQAGRRVLYFDFEDTPASVVARLRALGATDAQLSPAADLFAYVSPEQRLHVRSHADLLELLARREWALIGLDGVNAAMTLFGLSINSNDDATKFSQELLRLFARTGAAIVTVDHVGKNTETRGKGGIGAQAKRAMTSGTLISVDVLAPFGRGQTGKLKLTVDKDRPGYVRGFAENSRNVGIAVLESGSNGSVNVRIDPPGTAAAAAPVRNEWRPTAMMEKVSRLLSITEGELSKKQIEDGVDGRAVTIRRALELLVEEGYVSLHAGTRGALLHRYERTYREASELIAPEPGDDEQTGW